MKNIIILYIVLLNSVFAQFGVNKIQYKDHEWFYVQTNHFDIYFDQDGKQLADFVSVVAETSLESIQRDFDYEVQNRISLILYNSHNNFQETNTTTSMLGQGTGGFTELFKNRVVFPFDGSWKLYRHVIHHEMVHAVMNDMLYGGSIQNIISRNITLNLPLWFHEGMAEFLSSTWETKSDMFIRDAVQNESLPNIEGLGGYYAYRGGQSLFYYISQKYGREKVGELLKKTHDFGSLKSGLEESLGLTIEELNNQWKKYLKREYWPEINQMKDPEEFARKITDNKKNGGFYNTSPSISPQGDKIIFISDRDITYDIYIMDANDGKDVKKIVSTGSTIDFEELNILYPSLTWSPDNIKVALSEKSDGYDKIAIINTKSEEINFLPIKMESIGSVSWSNDGKMIAFSGSDTKQSDIYIYYLENDSLVNLTNDIFSDFEPRWSPNNQILYFSSDRNDYLNDKNLPADFRMVNEIYEYSDIYSIEEKSKKIVRLTDWKYSDEESPIISPDGKEMIFVSDKNGISNLYKLKLEKDSSNSDNYSAFPITNSLNEVNQLSISSDGSKLVFSSQFNAAYNIYLILNPFELPKIADSLENTSFMQKLVVRKKPFHSIPFDVVIPESHEMISDSGILVNSEVLADTALAEYQNDGKSTKTDSIQTKSTDFEIYTGEYVDEKDIEVNTGYKNYVFGVDTVFNAQDTTNLNSSDKFEAKLDEDENYAVKKYKVHFTPDIVYANVGYSTFYGVLGYTTMSYSDITGDHQIIGILGLQSDLKNSDYGIAYYYLPKRIDYGIELFHTARYLYLKGTSAIELNLFRNFSSLFSVNYPLSKFHSLGASINFMYLTSANLDDYSAPEKNSFYTIPAISYSHDNTMWGYYSPIQGTRYRITIMGNPGFTNYNESFYSILWDFRKYSRFWFDNSFVFRFSGGYSGGANPQRFFIGGTEGWLNYQWGTNSIPIDQPSDFLFLTPGLPLRGFDYAEQIGTKYGLLNLEYRFPFFRYIVAGPVPLLFQNILGATFLDAGSAWTNDSNLKLVSKNSKNESILNDLLLSSGIGLRTYFVFMWKFDVAWTTDGQNWTQPRYYFSLGFDF